MKKNHYKNEKNCSKPLYFFKNGYIIKRAG